MRVAPLLAGLALAAAAHAQPADPAPARAHVIVEAPAGVVFLGADTLRAHAPGAPLAVEPGADVRLTLADAPGTWNPRRAATHVRVPPGDTLRVAMALPTRYRVESLPLHALVVVEHADGRRDTLGHAPLTVDLPAGARATLLGSRDGFATARVPLGAPNGPVLLALRPEGLDAAAPVPVALLPTQRSTWPRTLTDLGIGAATLAAGAVAVHYKFRADSVDDQYRSLASAQRGSTALRDEASRLDRLSAIALGTMQVGLGVLAVRFALR